MQAPPLWVYFLAPVATLLAGLVGVVAAFLVGRYQGRAQTQHQESVRVVVEVRRRALDVIETINTWPDPISDAEEDEPDHWAMMKQVRDLVVYYRASTPWLAPDTVAKINPITEGLTQLVWQAVERWAHRAGYMEARQRIIENVVKPYEEAKEPSEYAELAASIRQALDEPPDVPEVAELVHNRLEPLAAELEKEARRLIGTDESRWRKLWRP